MNDIGWFRSNDTEYATNISGPKSETDLSGQSDGRDKVVAEAENVLTTTDPSSAVGDVNPGSVNDAGYGRITLTVSDDRYEPALDIINSFGGQIF